MSDIDVVSQLVTPVSNTISSSINGALPVVAGVFAVLVGIGLVMKLIKKGTK